MPTLLLIRHGRSSANTAQTLAGRAPGVHLDDRGREQAGEVRARLAGVDLAAVVTSPLERCVETATLAMPDHTPVPDERVIECDYGDWTNRHLPELMQEPLWQAIQAAPASVTFPNGESMTAMSNRIVAAVRDWDTRVRAEHGEWATWALVSHADPIKAAVAAAIGLPLDNFQTLVVHPAAISVLHFHQPDQAALLAWNSVAGAVTDLIPKQPPVQPGGGAGTDTPGDTP